MADTTDLIAAIQEGRTEDLTRLLTEHPALANERTDQGISPVLHALYHMQPEAAQILRSHARELDLFDASALGELARLGELIDARPEAVHAFASDGFQALHLACFFRQEEAAQLLIERGARMDQPTRNPPALLPLHSAAASRSTRIARRLIAAGADVDARQASGHTPLMGAAHGGAQDLVDLLLEAGADASLEHEGKTAADMAAEAGHSGLVV